METQNSANRQESETSKRRRTPIFTKDFIEELFVKWCNGKSLSALYRDYKETPKEFALISLVKIKEKYNWDERRNRLERELEEETDKIIKKANRVKVETINMIVDAASDVVRRDIQRYQRDPETFMASLNSNNMPVWLADTLHKLEQIYELHDRVVNHIGQEDNTQDAGKGMTLNQQFNIAADLQKLPPEVQSNMLKLLAVGKTPEPVEVVVEKDESHE